MKRDDTDWLTMNATCRRLRMSRSTVLRLINQGDLPAYRIGWMIRLRAADVEAYQRDRADAAGDGDQPAG